MSANCVRTQSRRLSNYAAAELLSNTSVSSEPMTRPNGSRTIFVTPMQIAKLARIPSKVLGHYPCQYVITSRDFAGGPQYTIRVRNWKTGDAVAAMDFSFKNATNAEKVDLDKLDGTGDLPKHFATGE